MDTKQRFIYLKDFGFGFTARVFARQLMINHRLVDPIRGTDALNEIKLERLGKEFSAILSEKLDAWNRGEPKTGSAGDRIWLFWYSGDMREHVVLRICYESILRHKPAGTEVIFVTKENLKQYIDLPNHIIEKVDRGLISLTHLSDIVRFKLLSRWGGTWFDATVFAIDHFPMINRSDFWTIRRPNDRIISIAKGKWTGFAIGGKPNVLFYLMSEFFDAYWKRYDVLIDFFLIDLTIEYLYRHFEQVKELLDSVPYNNENVQKLWPELNEPYNEETFGKIIGDTALFKLSYRRQWFPRTESGKITIFGKIANDMGIDRTD